MYVRLAFAVAAHLESEILIVDEVLAVGDAEFQKKCLGKMGEVSKGEGRTVLFVSHNMGSIKQLTQKAILLEHGALPTPLFSTEEVIKMYQYSKNTDALKREELYVFRRKNIDYGMLLEKIEVNGCSDSIAKISTKEQIEIKLSINSMIEKSNIEVLIILFNSSGEIITSMNSVDQSFVKPISVGTNEIKIVGIENIFVPDRYYAQIAITPDSVSLAYDFLMEVPLFEVEEIIPSSNWLDRPGGHFICKIGHWE
jgi:lipopolysaccharide transport system ATP-binding protein